MEEGELENSKSHSRESLMPFPRYRRSHLMSGTYHTLLRILSHCGNHCTQPNAFANLDASQEINNNLDNGLRQKSQEKEHENLQFLGNNIMNIEHACVSNKEKEVHEGSSGKQDMMIYDTESVEILPMGSNGVNNEQKKMEELNRLVKRTEDLVDNGSDPLYLGLRENQNGSSEVDLMDYQVEYVKFRGPDIDPSGIESELYIEGEFNQNISKGFDASLIDNIPTPEKRETSLPEIDTSSMNLVVEEIEIEKDKHGQEVHIATLLSLDDDMKHSEPFDLSIELERLQKEMKLVNPDSAEEGKLDKEGQHGPKVCEAMQFSVEHSTNDDESNSIAKHNKQKSEIDMAQPFCTSMVSLTTNIEGGFENGEQHGQKGSEAMGVSVDQTMNSEILISSMKPNRQQNEMDLVKHVSAAITSRPTTEEGEFKKEEQQGERAPEAMQFSIDQDMDNEASISHIKHEKEQKEMNSLKPVCDAVVPLPNTKEGEVVKEQLYDQKIPKAMHISVDQDMESEALIFKRNPKRQQSEMELAKPAGVASASLPGVEENKLEKEELIGSDGSKSTMTYVRKSRKRDLGCMNPSSDRNVALDLSVSQHSNGERENREEMQFMDIDILDAKHVIQHGEEKQEKTTHTNDSTFSNHPDKKENIEEGELPGDFRMDENSIDESSADSLMIEQRKHDVQNPKQVSENIVFSINKLKEEKEKKYESTHDTCYSGLMEPMKSSKNGVPNRVDLGISREVIDYGDLVDDDSVFVSKKSKDSRIKRVVRLPPTSADKKVLPKAVFEEATEDHQTLKKADTSCKKRSGSMTEERRAKRKEKKRKQRAENNRKLGVKRLKLLPVQKPKTIAYCHHYKKGRCHEGDKCKFSHDMVPITKSTPCCHFARHSCMKGDECPFDHDLSKYPCINFANKGSCFRGNACMFSHQKPTKQDVATSSNDGKAELKPKLLGNTKLSKPPNFSSSSASQQKPVPDSKGIQCHFSSGKEMAGTVKKPPVTAPKGISFINVSNSSSPKEGMVTPNKEISVQIGSHSGQSASGKASNSMNSEKTPMVAPKGINFLSFGKGRMSSFKSTVCSFLNKENNIKLSRKENPGTPEQASLEKGDCSKVGSGKEQCVLQTAACSNEILKQNQCMEERMDSGFKGKALIDHYSNDVPSSSTPHQDHGLSRSVQEGVKAYTPQSSTWSSPMLPTSPFISRQSSGCLASGHHKHVFNSAQRAFLSTLSFATDNESNIKLKFPVGTSAVKLEMGKDV